jgi:hypothetical protein
MEILGEKVRGMMRRSDFRANAPDACEPAETTGDSRWFPNPAERAGLL